MSFFWTQKDVVDCALVLGVTPMQYRGGSKHLLLRKKLSPPLVAFVSFELVVRATCLCPDTNSRGFLLRWQSSN